MDSTCRDIYVGVSTNTYSVYKRGTTGTGGPTGISTGTGGPLSTSPTETPLFPNSTVGPTFETTTSCSATGASSGTGVSPLTTSSAAPFPMTNSSTFAFPTATFPTATYTHCFAGMFDPQELSSPVDPAQITVYVRSEQIKRQVASALRKSSAAAILVALLSPPQILFRQSAIRSGSSALAAVSRLPLPQYLCPPQNR